ncbi:hypothetical protein SAMN04487928_12944 [Butyrivibrio proteoclasticus]|uniref:Transglutaminase-like superfamily protein n=1 Tax=Butyrivibrio proteoclasticus TaxID=43305 RepID=A0A1I5X9U2_9FIRM|nr:hypothetical protein [Butyrivibrio proteoclasticus]SFQ28616.1 hypothetical protein SAMN04487928_12944 [Butyrivibrio proteoclasticus]
MMLILKKALSVVLAVIAGIFIIGSDLSSLTVQAADDPYVALSKATTKYNGVDYKNEYNPLYYYLNYQDLRDAYGTDANKLIEHWVVFGKKEKRVANRLIGDSTEYVVPTGDTGVVIIPKAKHGNGGMTYDQEVIARSYAKQIAEGINKAIEAVNASKSSSSSKKSSSSSSSKTSDKNKVKDIEKVAYAAGVINAYCAQGTYTTEGTIYRTAYGVFVGGEYSCAGATRALGLVLDYLGITWVHKNANTWNDQWCQVIVDGKEGYADAITASAGYGKHPNEGGNTKDAVTYAKIRSKFDVASQRARATD